MAEPFSVLARDALTETLRNTRYDLVIIGGGITGAGIALDAASRGLKTALVEKEDFAFGTSSRSTKLIHGGLRYLKQFEFALVREVGSERAVVHRLAPHLVVAEKMLLPLYEKKGLGYWLTSIGLMIYDFLAGVRRADQRRMLTRAQTLRREPLLKKEGVKGGALYAEYRTDDARLTIEVIKMAAAHGAHVINYTRATGFLREGDRVIGVGVRDEYARADYSISARVVVNAAGPWVDELRKIDGSLRGKTLHLTKGVHIVFPHERFPIKQAIYFEVEDGRMVFAIPRGRTTYVGTTDTTYNGDKDRVTATRQDAEYLVRGVNATFAGLGLTVDDIESSWAGLRPLIHEEGKSESELSRKDEIFISPSGLISIAGGKLTGYRKMAERVVNVVVRNAPGGGPVGGCRTATLALTGDGFQSRRQLRTYLRAVNEALRPYAFEAHTVSRLVETYGRQTDHVLKYFFKHHTRDNAELSLLKAEAWFGIHHEMVVGMEDFFVRRTGLLYFNIQMVIRCKDQVGAFMKELLRWDDAALLREMNRIDELITQAIQFRNLEQNVHNVR